MKTFPKSAAVLAVLGAVLFFAGDLYRSFRLLVCVSGCVLLLGGWLLTLRWLCASENRGIKQIAKIVKILTFTALFAFLVSFVWVEGLILTHDGGTENPTAPTLVVLGAGLNGDQPSLTLIARLQTALDYLEAHPDAVAVVTGGQGRYETVTEASAMAHWPHLSGGAIHRHPGKPAQRPGTDGAGGPVPAHRRGEQQFPPLPGGHSGRAGRV